MQKQTQQTQLVMEEETKKSAKLRRIENRRDRRQSKQYIVTFRGRRTGQL